MTATTFNITMASYSNSRDEKHDNNNTRITLTLNLDSDTLHTHHHDVSVICFLLIFGLCVLSTTPFENHLEGIFLGKKFFPSELDKQEEVK